jgi:hypothetical protein
MFDMQKHIPLLNAVKAHKQQYGLISAYEGGYGGNAEWRIGGRLSTNPPRRLDLKRQ